MKTPEEIIFVFLLAFFLCLILTPLLIYYSRKRGVLDVPNQRASHVVPTPTLGGLPIFAGFLAVLLICIGFRNCVGIHFLVLSLFVLIATGVYDDIVSLRASLRLLIQIILAFWVASQGIRINSLYGFLGIHDLPIVFQYGLTVFVIVAITNAFNLIDGIDGLAGGLGFINMSVMGVLFLLQEQRMHYVICFGMAGALLAFLFFNFRKAKIFMGDTGSLVLGFLTAYLCLKTLQTPDSSALTLTGPQRLTVVIGLVIVPAYDMMRVAIQRILKRRSPFSADKTHIHHLLTRTGMNHVRASLSLYFVHVIILLFTFWLSAHYYWQGIFAALTIVVLAIEYPSLLQLRDFFGSITRTVDKSTKLQSKNRFL